MPAPEEVVDNKTGEIQEQPTREITQTDHINKKLLASLLKRMEGGDSCLTKMLEPDNNTEDNDEWED